MTSRIYLSNSLAEGTGILSREWSRHRVAPVGDSAVRFDFSIRSITPQLTLSTLAYGAPVIVHPHDRAEVLLLQMPRRGAATAAYSWGRAPLDASRYALIDVRHVQQLQCSTDLDVLVLRIGLQRLRDELERRLGRSLDRDLVFEPSITSGTPAWEAWLPVVAALEAVQRSRLDDFPPAAMQALEAMVVSTLLDAQPHTYSEALRRPAAPLAPRHVRLAESFIHAHLGERLDTARLAAHAGVSVRTLFAGFQAFRKTTPAAYLRDARLVAARQALAAGSTGVVEAAHRCGFRHVGRFAAHYTKRFGEMPEQTRRFA